MYIFERTKEKVEIIEVHEDEPNRLVVSMPVEYETDVRTIFRKLKRGSGFGGWTPAFMCVLS